MRVNFSAIPTSQILCSSEDAGTRAPAAVIHDGRMYCYYSYVERSGDGFTDFRLGLSVSEDLVHWEGPLLLTERDRSKNWSSPGCVLRVGDLFPIRFSRWGRRAGRGAQARLTAGFVLDARDEPGVGKYLMLFHGDQDAFPLCASIGLAWSDDLVSWRYAG